MRRLLVFLLVFVIATSLLAYGHREGIVPKKGVAGSGKDYNASLPHKSPQYGVRENLTRRVVRRRGVVAKKGKRIIPPPRIVHPIVTPPRIRIGGGAKIVIRRED